MGILRKMREISANLPLRRKFILVHVLMMAVVCAVIVAAAGLVFRGYNQMLYDSTAQILSMSASSIERDLLDIELLSESMVLDTVFQSAFQLPGEAGRTGEPNARKREPTSSYNLAAVEVMKSLTGYAARNADQTAISLYVEDQRFVTGRDRGEESPDTLYKIRELAEAADGGVVWTLREGEGESLLCARILKDVKTMTLDPLGLLVIRVDLAQVIHRNLKDNPGLRYIPRITVADADRVLYSDMGEDIARRSLAETKLHGVLAGDEGKFFVSRFTQSRFGWEYTLYLPFDEVLGSINSLRTATVAAAVFTTALSGVLFARIVSVILYHFQVLVKKMARFKSGDLPPGGHDYSLRRDELGFLLRSFDEMAKELHTLIQDNYVKQILIRDAQIKALQQQINPHFLFNILQTINWKAKSAGQREISEIVEALGKLVRYSLSPGALVSLGEEVEITRRYIALQSHRYGERLQTDIQVPEHLANAPVPRMTLQSIVENCIKHALENMLEPCHIRVYTKQEGNLFTLLVEDNGPGIDESVLEKPGEAGASEAGLGIGLRNLQSRIRLLLSDRCGLELHNIGSGTLVAVRLTTETPPQRGEEVPGDVEASAGG